MCGVFGSSHDGPFRGPRDLAPALHGGTHGGLPEILGLVGVVALMKRTGNDFVAALSGIAIVALARQFF